MKTPVITLPNEKNFTDSNIGCFILHDARSGAVQHDCQDTRKIQGRSLAGGYEKAGADTRKHGSCTGDSTKPADESKKLWIDRYLSVSYPLQRIRITSPYGYRKDPFTGKRKFHGGIDLHARGEQVLAMMEGVVVKVGQDKTSGKYVTLRHGNYTVSYCHLSRVLTAKGTVVRPRDAVGITGSTGRSTGEHLHITCKLNGKSVDPSVVFDYIRTTQQECISALSRLL